MQCSSRKFVASQVYYGLRIAHPDWDAERITDAVVAEADLLIAKLDRLKINNKGTKERIEKALRSEGIMFNGHARP
jgi:hypothetical protein